MCRGNRRESRPGGSGPAHRAPGGLRLMVDFGGRVRAGVGQDDEAVVEVGGLPEGGECYSAGGE